jgi:hypothetical protein
VLIQIGPLASTSVQAWTTYARRVLAQALQRSSRGPVLDKAVVDQFQHLLDSWEAAATAADTFVWSTDLDPDQVEYLMHAFSNLVARLADEARARGYPEAPPESEEFYLALVTGLLDALQDAGGAHAEFAEQLRSSWPGLKDS